ncbi:MNIO family bufferin maturase [Kiloniella sp. b19]|uniref:MNIO family bufferin maturase n=1 Tax=Kiloniella sp. GXU_MW_B19 TaxID=3141326 RepID=UPI0031E0A31A
MTEQRSTPATQLQNGPNTLSKTGSLPSSAAFDHRIIPSKAGIGLRSEHLMDFVNGRPETAWLEVHSENYLAEGGPRQDALLKIRENYAISCHGVGLSLGSYEGLDEEHLARLKALYAKVEPGLVSDHVSWSVTSGTYLNDLLPLPYTEEALDVICRNVEHAQESFGRQILIENPSSYVSFIESTMPEWEFMSEIVRRTGCGLLLDVNNIHVSAENHDFDAEAYLKAVPLDKVQEIHVAGHLVKEFDERTILIDDHGSMVNDAVWALFTKTLDMIGAVPTLVEWDTNVPALDVLLGEAEKAQLRLDAAAERRSGAGHAA